ncbi:kelch-like protein 1 [Eurosta solidaginis]|uniref:kelch-like protein 1 n=1 Tax=Eurosta solidaginis TaxID=178769 RepID=UPI0035317C92
MAECNTRQRLSEIGHDAVQYFMEKLLFNIYDRFDEQDLTDVTFKLSNPNAMVKAHRLILSAASPYFRDLFRDEKGICPVIEINNIDSDIFEQLIIFCYTGKTFITNDNVERVLKAALILQLEDTVADCGDFIIENISNYSIKRVYALEREIQCATLNQKLFEYETQNFMSVAESEEFLDFDANKLQKILECNSLNAPTERDVFEAVKRWYDYDALGRKQHLQDLISCLRLTQLDTTFLLTEIQTLPGCESIVVNALSWTNCPALRSNLTLKYTEKRGSQTTSNELLFALNIKERENKNIFQYDNDEGVWYKWFDVKITISDFGVIFMDTNFIFIGGSRCGKAINDVSRWNFKTKTFEQLPSMNQPRHSHSVLLLNETIYAIGGKDEHGV